MTASAVAFLLTLRRARRLMFDAKLGDDHVVLETVALIVSNNIYGGGLPALAERLDAGLLGVYSLKSHHWIDLARLWKDATLGRWKDNVAMEVHAAQSIHIERRHRPHRTLTVAVDGELREIRGAIEVEIEPRSLRVLAGVGAEPAQAAERSQVARP
jgi:diacylglycerol kinase family enzyme